MTDDKSLSTTWAALVDASPEDRIAGMTATFTSVAALGDAELAEAVAALLAAEAELVDQDLQALAGGRLRALPDIDPDGANRIVTAWEVAEKSQPANLGMRRVFALQAAARSLSLDEVSRVEPLMPTVRQMAGLAPARKEQPIAAGDLVVEAPPRRGFLSKLFSRS